MQPRYMPITLILLLLSKSVLGDSLKGRIEFTSKPPLVALIYIPGSVSKKATADIDQVGKTFTKKMTVVSPQGKITFRNSDSVDHNVFVNDLHQGAKFDIGLMAPGGSRDIDINWKDNSIVRVGCKIHPKMRTYLANIDTQYYEVIEFKKEKKVYTFEIDDVPKSANKIFVRIPKYDLIELEINQNETVSQPILKRGKTRGKVLIGV